VRLTSEEESLLDGFQRDHGLSTRSDAVRALVRAASAPLPGSVELPATLRGELEEIVDAAKERKADLIVLGLHGSVRFTSHLPERLSYRVLCDAPCPVMSVLPGTADLKLAELPVPLQAVAEYSN
jgi:nucleotide-binding universal stress UspA family protein